MFHTPACEFEDVIVRIRERLDTLSPQSRKVAVYILEDPMILGFCGIQDFARRCLVPTSCVFRFAKQMGFSGFRAMRQTFKLALKRRLQLEERNVALSSIHGLRRVS